MSRLDTTAKYADTAELNAFINKEVPIESGLHEGIIAGGLEMENSADIGYDNIQDSDITMDSMAGDVKEEIERRQSIMNNYPFDVNGPTLKLKPVDLKTIDIYKFMLDASIRNDKRMPRVFERLAANLIMSYFGKYACVIHTGFPRDEKASFKDVMRCIANRTEEFIWQPESDLNCSNIKDAGVDFVIWLKHADNRKIAHLFILGQCACGNNWATKLCDLNIDRLRKLFHPMTIFNPVKAFATPYHVTNETIKESSRDSGGLFFDRARLVSILDGLGKLEIEKIISESGMQEQV